MASNVTDSDRLVPIAYFTSEMLGVTRQWYYRHQNDEGMPRRVYVGGSTPKLVLAECQAYVDLLKGKRAPVKRKRGRPKKAAAPMIAA